MTDTLPSILLVEDDENLGIMVQEYLQDHGHATTLCRNGQLGWDMFQQQAFDICVLDVQMPVMDGFTFAKKIRGADSQIPIIFLTARSLNEDKSTGFQLGADDYITKPFNPNELRLRIAAIWRRAQNTTATNEPATNRYTIGRYTFHPLQQQLTAPDQPAVRLTTKETELLEMLCQHKNEVLEREVALKQIWGNDTYFTARSMDVFITKLRKYLEGDPQVEILNVHSRGYKLVDKSV